MRDISQCAEGHQSDRRGISLREPETQQSLRQDRAGTRSRQDKQPPQEPAPSAAHPSPPHFAQAAPTPSSVLHTPARLQRQKPHRSGAAETDRARRRAQLDVPRGTPSLQERTNKKRGGRTFHVEHPPALLEKPGKSLGLRCEIGARPLGIDRERRLEFVQRSEAPLGSQATQQFDAQFSAVDIRIEVEEMHLDGGL